MKNIKQVLVIAQLSLAVGLICFMINYFFFAGVLIGLSLVFNLNYLIRRRKINQV